MASLVVLDDVASLDELLDAIDEIDYQNFDDSDEHFQLSREESFDNINRFEDSLFSEDINDESTDVSRNAMRALDDDGGGNDQDGNNEGDQNRNAQGIIIGYLRGIPGFTRVEMVFGGVFKFTVTAGAILFILKLLYEYFKRIVDAMENDKLTPTLKDSLTESDKKELKKLDNSMIVLTQIFTDYRKQFLLLKESGVKSFGTMTNQSSGKPVEVLNVIGSLLEDAHIQLVKAAELLKDPTVLDVKFISHLIFLAFADAQAIVFLKEDKSGIVKNDQLKLWDYPDEDDINSIQWTLLKDFPQWLNKVKEQALQAKLAVTKATSAFLKIRLKAKVEEYLRKTIDPKLLAVARKAFKAAAKKEAKSKKWSAFWTAFNPFGDMKEKVKEIGKAVIKKGKEAAKEAIKEEKKRLEPDVKAKVKELAKSLATEYKDQIREITANAIRDMDNVAI